MLGGGQGELKGMHVIPKALHIVNIYTGKMCTYSTDIIPELETSILRLLSKVSIISLRSFGFPSFFY